MPKHKDIPLNGKLITAEPSTIGTNFRTLKNMEYTDTHPRSVQGMTKANSTALTTYLKTRNAFHFRKYQPSESHLLIQAYNTGETASQVLQNTTAIPSTGDFSGTALWTDSSGAGQGYFADAPNGQVAYANGVDVCLWGGNEVPCAYFALFNPAATATTVYNYTDQVSNTKTDALNIATLRHMMVISFTTGAHEPVAGETITGNTSAATGVVDTVTVTSGTWGGGTAAGTICMYSVTGIWQNAETIKQGIDTVGTSSSTCSVSVRIGTTRPAKGFKIYVGTANASTATVTGTTWDGSSWAALAALSDGTASSGKTLAQTGSITFTDTVGTAKIKWLDDTMFYFYTLVFAGVDPTTTISYVTFDAVFQPIVDLWDGVKRDIFAFYCTGEVGLVDNTSNVLKKDYYDGVTTSYANIGWGGDVADASHPIYLGFPERMTAIEVGIGLLRENDLMFPSPVVTIERWNGAAWVSVGAITDKTLFNDGPPFGVPSSFRQSGIISWDASPTDIEFKRTMSNSILLYYYRISFPGTQHWGDIFIDYFFGIPVQKVISHYKFPMFAQGRLFLCNDQAGEKNKITCSAKYLPQAFNGTDSVDLFFGDEGDINCGTELFTTVGSNIYSVVMVMKDNETWAFVGQDPGQWENNIYILSPTIGCPAPLTLKVIGMMDSTTSQNKSYAIWQGTTGVYMSDGRAPIPIHGDIKEYFDPTDSRFITRANIRKSVGFIDQLKGRYHWLFFSGTGATLKELVFDLKRGKWFEINRGTGKYLRCGLSVQDTDGNQYPYGFIDTGYMERLEYGTTFDGNAIVSEFQLGDFPLSDVLFQETSIGQNGIKLLMAAKTVTANNVTATYYGNSGATGYDITMLPTNSGYRLAGFLPTSVNYGPCLLHSLKFSMTTTDETIGFEPVGLSISYEPVREV